MMKHFFLFLFFLPSVLSAQQPEVGFLQIYNLLSDGVETLPMIGEKKLTSSPLKPGENLSGLYHKAGKYELKLWGENAVQAVRRIEIKNAETLTILIVHGRDSQKKRALKVISLGKSRPLKDGFLPLKVRSFSPQKLMVDFRVEAFPLSAMGEKRSKNWKGRPFPLKINGEAIGSYKAQGKFPHTLLIWEKDDSTLSATLIPETLYNVPKGLRKDLSFGKKREDFRNLKRLPVNKE